ncbi:toxin glutamine deamidase domain-containing protein [Nocardia sp. NPDC058705]|uniref:toxin glutamine deamidase domain-containing protein n=1 Tax=Nocardia sp. NPDC058705 TaxID=3346609 RepID=UPI0036CFD05D
MRHVGNPQSGRSFTWSRFTNAFDAPVSMLRIGIRVTGTGNLDPAVVQALLERAQLAVDLHFNRGDRLLSGDWMMVDLVPVSDPAAADMTIDLDAASPHSTSIDADFDTLTELLREQLGLPPNGTDLDPNDLRELSNSIARANTPAALDGLPDTRVEGPKALDSLEQAEYQHDVEDALRDGNRFLVGADPRTNDYGHLINDGGPDEQGRSNNCLDGSLAALSSFNGRPEVGSPRWPDLDDDGELDTRRGEEDGIDRATAWLGGTWQLGDANQAVSAQFQALHDQIRSMGPGASALVVNTWHARDSDTGELLYESDGSPQVDGSHATVVVYPHGATGPVWWDPQLSAYSETPPHYLTSGTVELWSMPVDTQGVANAGSTAGHQGTSAGIPGGSVPNPDVLGDRVQPRVGLSTGAEPGTESSGPGTRPDELRPQQADRDSDSASEPAPVDDRGELRPGGRDRPAGERPTDLPETPTGELPAPGRDSRDDHVPSDSDVAGEPDGTNRDLPTDLRQTNPEAGPTRPDGLTGDLEGTVAQPTAAELAEGRDDRGLVGQTGSDQPRIALDVDDGATSIDSDQEWSQSGAAMRPHDPSFDDAWAAEAYDHFRASDDDVPRIAAALADVQRSDGSTGFTDSEIAQIKNHLMREQHLLRDYDTGGFVLGRFDPSADQAEAWIRLIAGRPLSQDIVMLEHELTESNYMRAHPDSTYPDAHAVANQQHNWQDDIPARTGERYDQTLETDNGTTGVLRPGAGDLDASRIPVRDDGDGPRPHVGDRQADSRVQDNQQPDGRDSTGDSRPNSAQAQDGRVLAEGRTNSVLSPDPDVRRIDTDEDGPPADDPRRLGRTHPNTAPDHAPPPDTSQGPDDSPTQPLPVLSAIPLSARLQGYFDIGESTPAGRSYFEESDSEMREYAQWVGALPNFYTIDMHGDPEAVFIGDDELSPEDLAALIRADPRWQNRSIRLLCCETGQGQDPFAQHLANELGVQVWAPNEVAWTDEDGTVVVATEVEDPLTGEVDAKDPPDGDWILFEPENQQ